MHPLEELGESLKRKNFPPVKYDDSGLMDAYEHAQSVLAICNGCYKYPSPMQLPPENQMPVIPAKIQFQLSGVFFHFDDEEYKRYYGRGVGISGKNRLLSENKDNCINIFVYGNSKAASNGVASSLGGDLLAVSGMWYQEVEDFPKIQAGETVYSRSLNGRLLAHELGHCLSLYHTILSRYDTDDLSDTPSYDEMDPILADKRMKDDHIGQFWIPALYLNGDTIRDENIYRPYKSNNLMDYNPFAAVTPLQVGKMRHHIAKSKANYLRGVFDVNYAVIREFVDNKTYIARRVSSESNKITIERGKALYVCCEEAEIGKNFEVKKGGVLEIIPETVPYEY
jgi:hypothetical protein